MEKLSKRLVSIIEFADHADIIADIGTDHAYVPICLIKKNKANSVIATDKNKGPLLIAKQNAEFENVSEKILLRLGSGLSPLKENEADEIIISGMGGRLIIDILRDGLKIIGGAALILSPHTDVFELRLFLHEAGFFIKDEIMIMEDGKYYNIIKARKGREKYEDEFHYRFGRILMNRKDVTLKSFAQKNYNKLINIRDEISEKASGAKRLCEIKREIALFARLIDELTREKIK